MEEFVGMGIGSGRLYEGDCECFGLIGLGKGDGGELGKEVGVCEWVGG